jgi:glutathione S-transferase
MEWNYLAMCLFTLIDWAQFRSLADLSTYSSLQEFFARHQGATRVKITDPRL